MKSISEMRFVCLIYIIALLTLFSCEYREPLFEFAEGEFVEVPLKLNVDDEYVVDINTKSDNGPEIDLVPSDVVRNLLVLQYRGTDENALFVGEPVYISNYPGFSGKLKMVATDAPSLVVILANIDDPSKFQIAAGSSILDLSNMIKRVSCSDDMLMSDSDGVYHLLNDIVIKGDGIDVTDEIECELRRTAAKFQVTVANECQGLTINSVQLCSVPAGSYYLTDNIPADVDTPSSASIGFIDYPEEQWHAEVYTYYMPVNQRGTIFNNSEFTKNRYAPDNATYLQVCATYDSRPVIYKFYLGRDMVKDFNISPNHSYKLDITIISPGDPEVDSRVEDWGLVDYSDSRYELANSYILNPMPATLDGWRTFRIPIQRAKVFWGTAVRHDYENDERLSFRTAPYWEAFVLASDFVITEDNFKITKSDNKKDSAPYFEVSVSSGLEGNVIVAVGPSREEVSWSWHLWITNYDPYESMDWGPGVSGQYVYPVEGGKVHRYEGTYWANNRSVYIMDRNLGALSLENQSKNGYPEDDRGLLYYQFGRKDPFFYHSSSKNHKYHYPQDLPENLKRKAVDYGTADVKSAVKYPLSFYCSYQKAGSESYYEWTTDEFYNPSEVDNTIIWFDHLTKAGGIREGEKSIFDPCPPGFRLPDKSIWSDFETNDKSKWSTNTVSSTSVFQTHKMQGGFGLWREEMGLQYWPYQSENFMIPDDVVYYPSSGFQSPDKGNNRSDYHTYDDAWAFAWSGNVISATNGSAMTAQNDHLAINFSAPQSRGLPVRCVTDK